jgi:hypothetical protein
VWIIENGVRIYLGHPFFRGLVLDSEMDSNLLGLQLDFDALLLSAMVVDKEEDVLGHL